MPRTISQPPFPVTPGGWLACYRYRSALAMGLPPTPEQLGSLLGVSGSTVRRWEEGRSQPDSSDLARIGHVCHLHPMETQFLRRAFGGYLIDLPLEEDVFREKVTEILSAQFPAFLTDYLGYVRARNSYCSAIGLPLRIESNEHVVEVFARLGDEDPGAGAPLAAFLDFWYETSAMCGTEAYRQTLDRLRRVPGFEDFWNALAFESLEDIAVLNAPRSIEVDGGGWFRMFMNRIQLPPTYHLYEFAPCDDDSYARVAELRRAGSPAVVFAPTLHW